MRCPIPLCAHVVCHHFVYPSALSNSLYLANWRTLKEIGKPIKNMCTKSP